MDFVDQFKKGTFDLMLLCLLREEDRYGYQLTKLVVERSNGIISINEGSLYPALYRLLENQYISERSVIVGKRMRRNYYHLEEKGQRYLEELIAGYTTADEGIRLIINSANQ
jgi:PadR family transcriptional regulator PadR